MLKALLLLIGTHCQHAVAAPVPANYDPTPARATLAAGASFPFPYNWSKFPAAWFAANATDWEDEAQLDEIGKYSMAILGWQHLDTETEWTAVVYTQLTQAAIIKSRHPDIPVFVYCGYGFAFGLNAGTFPVMQDVMKDPVSVSPPPRVCVCVSACLCVCVSVSVGVPPTVSASCSIKSTWRTALPCALTLRCVRNRCTAVTATFSCSRSMARSSPIPTASKGTRPPVPQATGALATFGIWPTHLPATTSSRISSSRLRRRR